MPDPRKYVFIQSPNGNFADVDRIIHYQVAETFDLPEKKPGQYIVVIQDLYKARLGVRIRPQDSKTFKIEDVRSQMRPDFAQS
jgi:hypothetical protein